MFKQDVPSRVAVEPAPVDPAELERSLLPFGSSRMLPKAAYLDPAVLAWERRHIFDGWTCVGPAADVAGPRTLRGVATGTGSVLLSRDEDGRLRAFENACRHRGHELLPCGGSASPRAIVCPYHAWTYDFDGSLRGAPGFRDAPGFDKTAYGLAEVPTHEWQGWVFVDASGHAGDFADRIGHLEEVISPYDPGSLRVAASHSYDVAANWKIVIENYQECYHCSNIHPELCRVSPPDSGENIQSDGDWVGGWMELRSDAETMSLDGRSSGLVMARLDELESRTVMYLAVMPNLLVSLHPDYVMTHLLRPLGPELTHIECSWAFPAQAVERAGFDPSYAVDFWDLTNRQDWAACESVQRGIHARHFQPGPLAPEEDGVYQFVTYMARAYQGRGAVAG